jgi:hypothetical protein
MGNRSRDMGNRSRDMGNDNRLINVAHKLTKHIPHGINI